MGGWHRPAGPVEALGVPLHVPMLPPFAFALPLIKVSTPCWFLANTKEVGPAGLMLSQKFSNFFFVKFSNAKLSNFKHGLVEIQNMIMQVGKKIMHAEI